MGYRTWKYWHAGMYHAKAMAVVIAFDIYKECCTGSVSRDFEATQVDFFTFREKLSKQMLTCDPRERKYYGDEKFRVSTQQPKKIRTTKTSGEASSMSSGTVSSMTSTGVSKATLQEEEGRICGFLDEILLHESSMEPLLKKTHLMCQCCGKQAFHRCTRCPGKPVLHLHLPKDRKNSCFLHCHNTSSLGKWKCDWRMTGTKRKDWEYPNKGSLDMSRKEVRQLHERLVGATASSADRRQHHNDPQVDSTWNDQCL